MTVKVKYNAFKPIIGQPDPPEGVTINGVFYEFGNVHDVSEAFFNEHSDIFIEVETNE